MNTLTAPPKAGHFVRGSSDESMTVCVLDDEPGMVEMLQESLRCLGFSSIGTSDPQYALELIDQGRVRVVMSDIKMPGMDGLQFLEQAMQRDPGVYVLLMTGYYSLDNAIAAVKRGAYDYVPKPVDRSRLKKSLDELAESFNKRKRIRGLEQQLLSDLEFHGIVGRSPAMVEVFEMVRKVARHYTNILLIGATGAGKELIAKSIHQMSPVAQQRFAVCNCSAMVDTLLESQLFGHMRGAFTGATDTRPGLFEYANGGTVFLGRSGRNFAPHAGQTAARDPEPRNPACRLAGSAPRGCAAHCRYQPRLARRGSGRPVSRRLVLSPQHDPDSRAQPGRAPGRYSACSFNSS